jgi:DMSO reductase family type II enzyme heme b subunit
MRIRGDGAREFYAATLKEQEGLTDEEIAEEDVQAEIQDYATRFTTPGESSAVPDVAPPAFAAIMRGKALYAQRGCLSCHGAEGKGDGVQKMVDDEKMPTAPRDFTRGIFKGGHDAASLYRRIAYGMPGTPMPSATNMTQDEMVDLVHFVRSLSTEADRQAAMLARKTIVAQAVSAMDVSPDAALWSEVASVSLPMAPLWWRNDADPGLAVQAIHDGRTLSVRLSWRDAAANWHALQSEAFEDAAAVQFYRGPAEPFLGMGARDAPIDVWFWDADRQTASANSEGAYPNTVVDIYPFNETVVETAEYSRSGARLAHQPDVSLPARASGNPITPSDTSSAASSLTAGGPGTATFRVPKSQLVNARGQWKDGQWAVVMTRSLALASPDDGVSLSPGDRVSVAFAIWDGAHQDRDGKKQITIWQDLELK